MPVKPAAAKALRQSQKNFKRNKKAKSDIAALVKRLRQAVAAKDVAKAKDWFKQVVKKVDKSRQQGIIPNNTAARQKSRLAKVISRLAKN